MGGRGSTFQVLPNQGIIGKQKHNKNSRGYRGKNGDDWFEEATKPQSTSNIPAFQRDKGYKLNKVNITVMETFDKLPIEIAEVNAKHFKKLQTDMNSIGINQNGYLGKDKSLELYSGSSDSSVIGEFRDNKIAFNREKFKSERDIQQRLEKEISRSQKAKINYENAIVYTATHEYGHFLQEIIIFNRIGHANESLKYQEADKIRREILETNRTRFNDKVNAPSLYALENSYEWFAETFTESQLSNGRSNLSKSMMIFLHKEGKIK